MASRSFQDCVLNLHAAQELSNEEASDLIRTFETKYAQGKFTTGDVQAASAVKQQIAKEKRIRAAQNRRRVAIDRKLGQELLGELTGYRTPGGAPDIHTANMEKLSGYGTAGFRSMRGTFEAIMSMIHSDLAATLRTFRRSTVLGLHENRVLAGDVMDALHGDPVKDPKVKALADALAKVAEYLRVRGNAAGRNVAKLENWGWAHVWRAENVIRAGYARFEKVMLDNLAPEKMIDPFTGQAPTPADLKRGIKKAYDGIVSGGWADVKPSMRFQGKAALANQGQEHRYFVFKSGKAWRDVDAEFGVNDPIASWFEYLIREARDIAALETLGTNPSGRVEWMIQLARSQIGKKQAGQPSLAGRADISAGPMAEWRTRELYNYLRGAQTVDHRVAGFIGDIRNLANAAVLGTVGMGALILDPFVNRLANKMAGLHQARNPLGVVMNVFSKELRENNVRNGFMMDDFLNIFRDEARLTGMLDGHEWSRWVTDRTVTWSFLKPFTTARKALHQQEWQATLADYADHTFDRLPELLRRSLKGSGIDATDWNVMRSAPIFRPQQNSGGLLRPRDIADLADGPALPGVQKLLGITEKDAELAADQARVGVRRVAEKYVEMVLNWTERAVPSGTPNTRSLLVGSMPRGSIPRELLEGVLSLKNFALSFSTMQMQTIAMEAARKGKFGAAKYVGGMLITLTLGGAIYAQVKALLDGKDPRDMTDPKFWMEAAAIGGGLGIAADFITADYSRYGNKPLTFGPGIDLSADTINLAFTAQRALFTGGQDANLGRTATQFLRRWTPVVSSHWATRGAWNRVFLDQLQYLIDPEAHKSFRGMQGNLKKRTGQEFYVKPGGGVRAPDFGAAIGQ